MKKWVHISEAVKILGVSERTIRRRIDEGELKKKKKDRRVYIEVEVEETEKEKKQQEKEKDFTERAIDMLEKTLDNQSKQIQELKELVQNEQVINRELLNRLPQLQAPSEEQDKDNKASNKRKRLSKWWLLVLPFVLLVIALGILFLYYRGLI